MRYAKRYSNVKGWERTMAQSFVFTAETRKCEKALNKAVIIHLDKELRKYGLRPSGWSRHALHERTMDLLKAEVNL
tara:strand:- start:266 stop:493 length:228 start_codon:yes stop_codon:yes gene_type:complete